MKVDVKSKYSSFAINPLLKGMNKWRRILTIGVQDGSSVT